MKFCGTVIHIHKKLLFKDNLPMSIPFFCFFCSHSVIILRVSRKKTVHLRNFRFGIHVDQAITSRHRAEKAKELIANGCFQCPNSCCNGPTKQLLGITPIAILISPNDICISYIKKVQAILVPGSTGIGDGEAKDVEPGDGNKKARRSSSKRRSLHVVGSHHRNAKDHKV